MTMPFLIITASYNRSALLKRNIESLQAQTCTDWMQIIVDDCSTDVMDDAFSLAADDPRIVLIRLEENSGCNHARNTALDYIAQHKLQGWVTLVDDDDYLLPDALESLNGLMQATPGYRWYTANCCYPDLSRASALKRHGRLSYLHDYMFGRIIKGDLHHCIDSRLCAAIRFTAQFRNGQEWSFFCQLAADNAFYAFDRNVKVVEYLPDGLSRKKVNSQQKVDVCRLKVDVLRSLVKASLLAQQQVSLARELIKAGETNEALEILCGVLRYQYLKPRYYRYLITAWLAAGKH